MKTIAKSFLLAALVAFSAQADLTFSVSSNASRAQPIAIAPFVQSIDPSVDVAQIIDDDLAHSGMFVTLPRANMLEKPTDVSQINTRNWQVQNMSYVVIGKAVPGATPNSISVNFTLVDVLHDSPVAVFSGNDIPGKDKLHWRSAAHQAADMIFEKLTGIRGVFNTQIAYVDSSGNTPATRKFELYIADSDGKNKRMIARSREPLMSPAWSPDTRKIAFVGYEKGYSGIYILNLDTGQFVDCAGGSSHAFMRERGINGAPAWSPDGTKLAVTLSFEKNPDIYVADVSNCSRNRLTTDPGIDTEATWSPDGSTIVFASDRGGQPQLYSVPSSGGPQTRITFQGNRNEDPSFSPDGKWLALVNSDGSGYHIGLMDWQTKAVKIVSDGFMDEHPRFAPNSQVVIYTTQGSGGEMLRTTTVDGRVHQNIPDPGTNVREPAWSPWPQNN